jgi:EpsI family protein
MRSPHLWLVVLLMSFTALVLHVRGDQDRVLPSLPLSGLPTTIGSRTAVEVEIPDEELQVLGKGDFLNRDYQPDPHARGASPGDLADIGLFIAYFPTQRSGQSIHSPQHCLPGAGWVFESKSVAELTDPAGKKYRVGDYLITNGTTTDEALYWYQLHGRSIPGDYQAKLYTLADSIRYGRTDEALVRIITPVVAGEDRAEARDRALDFARQIAPLLPAYVPN